MLEDSEFGTKQQLGANQLRWIKALESGDYKQCRGALYDKKDGSMCALGVACDLFGAGIKDRLFATSDAIDALSLNNEYGSPHTATTEIHPVEILNDVFGMSFADIAQHLRDNAEAYFKEPK